MHQLKLSKASIDKFLPTVQRTQQQQRCREKLQESRPALRTKRNLEYTNESKITPHISQHNPDKPIIKFKNSFVCYGNSTQSKIIAVVKCHSFEGMDPEKKEEYKRLSCTLIVHTKFQNDNKSNRHKLGGKMYSLGWRKGYEEKNKLGVTAITSKVAKDQTGFINLFDETPFINNFLADRFRDVSLKMYNEVKEYHNNSKAPSLSPIFFADPDSFCCHLSFTFDNFYNKAHTDSDSSPYSFVMWIPIDKKTGQLVEENFEVEGGDFVFPNDGCAINFTGFNGVVKCALKATQYEHHTLEPKTPPRSLHTRLGKAKCALDKIKGGEYDEETEWTFRDVGKIIIDSLKYDEKGKLIKKKDDDVKLVEKKDNNINLVKKKGNKKNSNRKKSTKKNSNKKNR
ncbi:hypothetical protein MJO28_016474 [Puccinia striiformis f. sp. tritici]|uniref:Uncharacterized protein n=1 Tax=Puccinia striiformis f. sp. tritici TaxID=168172 RepID=A0ACC0DPN0_9BASI|nr:hypothetical protein MJO28_016474 [Puccinia striiformis f. sp. tritici]